MRVRRHNPQGGQGRTAGMTLIEISVSIAIVAAVLLASASSFSTTIKATEQGQRTTEAGIFLETTMENVAAQPYANLLSLDGNLVFDEANAGDSNYSAAISVWLSSVDLLQIRVIITDLRTGRAVARLTTLRSRR